MCYRSFRLCLFLLVSIGASRNGFAKTHPFDSPFEVDLARSPRAVSAFQFTIRAKSRQSWELDSRGPLSKCHIIASPGLSGKVKSAKAGSSGTSATFLEFVSTEVLVTSDGIWDATLTLDPDRAQPESPMALERMLEDPDRGVFAGVLEMNANLHLVNRETGETADLGLSLGFSLAAPWALSHEESPSASGLVLVGDRDDDPGPIGPVDIDLPLPTWEEMKTDDCRLGLKLQLDPSEP